jgi:hypothetical protein
VAATASRLETLYVFSWAPFATDPQSLELLYDNGDPIECVDLLMRFEDAACRRENLNCPL